jgi:hypothetical protein
MRILFETGAILIRPDGFVNPFRRGIRRTKVKGCQMVEIPKYRARIGSVISNIAEQLASNQTCFFEREGGAKAWVAMESTQLIIAELRLNTSQHSSRPAECRRERVNWFVGAPAYAARCDRSTASVSVSRTGEKSYCDPGFHGGSPRTS